MSINVNDFYCSYGMIMTNYNHITNLLCGIILGIYHIRGGLLYEKYCEGYIQDVCYMDFYTKTTNFDELSDSLPSDIWKKHSVTKLLDDLKKVAEWFDPLGGKLVIEDIEDEPINNLNEDDLFTYRLMNEFLLSRIGELSNLYQAIKDMLEKTED